MKPSLDRSVGLEEELEGELHDSGAGRCDRRSEGGRASGLRNQARSPRNSADGGRGGARKLRRAHSVDVGVVQHVERFPDKLQAYALGKLHITRHARVQGNGSRKIESISAESRRSICGRVAVVVQVKIH